MGKHVDEMRPFDQEYPQKRAAPYFYGKPRHRKTGPVEYDQEILDEYNKDPMLRMVIARSA